EPPAGDAGAELRAAATEGNVERVRALLASGVDVNAKSEYGATALSFACDKGRTEVVRLLLEKGAEVEVEDTFYHSTPAVWAAYNGHAEVIRLLLEKGVAAAPIAMMAVGREHPEVLKVVLASGKLKPQDLTDLIDATADPSQAGDAPMKEIVQMLQAAGAKPSPPANAKVDPGLLASYAGRYVGLFRGVKDYSLTLYFDPQAGTLSVSFYTDPSHYTLGAVDDTHFRSPDLGAGTLAVVRENDQPVALDLIFGGETTRFARAAHPTTEPGAKP
nr:ankyrin repeat domain-containing protein [Thermoanaerobaculia bacterium]